MTSQLVTHSKFLSLVLRHQPETIGLVLDPEGWANIAGLIDLAQQHGVPLSRATVDEIVATSDKRRFALSADGLYIRANQGHSVEVDLKLEPISPPAILFHGTASRFVAAIRSQGLRPGSRQHVHLSATEATALEVGRRHGQPVVLVVQAGAMHAQGHAFFRAANGVWLTAAVPPEHLVLP